MSIYIIHKPEQTQAQGEASIESVSSSFASNVTASEVDTKL